MLSKDTNYYRIIANSFNLAGEVPTATRFDPPEPRGPVLPAPPVHEGTSFQAPTIPTRAGSYGLGNFDRQQPFQGQLQHDNSTLEYDFSIQHQMADPSAPNPVGEEWLVPNLNSYDDQQAGDTLYSQGGQQYHSHRGIGTYPFAGFAASDADNLQMPIAPASLDNSGNIPSDQVPGSIDPSPWH